MKKRILAKDLPKTCLSQCSKCKNNYSARISIQSTCNECTEKDNQELDRRVQEALKLRNILNGWMLKLEILAGIYEENKSR